MKGISLIRILKILAMVLTVSFWPLGLFLHNRLPDLGYDILLVLPLGLSYLTFKLRPSFWPLPLLLVDLLAPRLVIFPLAAAFLAFLWQRTRLNGLILLLALTFSLLAFRSFLNQSIFFYDHNAQQKIISQSYLYPSVWTARLFQNKPAIFWHRAEFNFFALVDPNNYFFAFHPREITVDNQNLAKFPFLAIIFFLLGIYHLPQTLKDKFLALTLIPSLLTLALLKNFDRFDVILYLPLLLIVFSGWGVFEKKYPRWRSVFYLLFLIFSVAELFNTLALPLY